MADTPIFKPILRLQIIISVVIPDAATGEDMYNTLKENLRSQVKDISISGNIVKMLEPCCGPKPKNQLSQGVANVSSG